MKPSGPLPAANRLIFPLLLGVTLLCYAIYGANLFAWRRGPDYGWRTMFDSGPNVVAQVMEAGEKAGLKPGDIVRAINGREYSTFDELFFGLRNAVPGSTNTYTVERAGRRFEAHIETGTLGTRTVLTRSGPLLLLGFLYVLIGVLVFLMKPQGRESLVFFVMTAAIGMTVSFSAPSDVIRPLWFYRARDFATLAFSAAAVHLALQFPKTRDVLRRQPRLWVTPYLVSLMFFLAYEFTAPSVFQTSPALDLVFSVFMPVSILFFLLSTVWNVFRDRSPVVRLQSQVIFMGILIGFMIPSGDLLLRTFSGAYLFPDPVLGFTLLLTAFPISIGYTIVRHDLFAIDTIVRRTYGYMLSTAVVVAVYGVLVSALNVTLRSTDASRSPLFSILFALGVVFSFRPLHDRVQGFVDRVFYRRRYDYRRTIGEISETMTGMLDRSQIQVALVGSVVREMFLESGHLLLPSKDGGFHSFRGEGAGVEGAGDASARILAPDAPLLKRLQELPVPLVRQEVELDPAFVARRDALLAGFDALGADLVLPLRHKERLQGIVALGRKKSGKLFTAEDLDLLKTMANQSAIALENATLFQENLEKGRMEEELKIAHDLQMSMLPEKPPQVAGVRIAARSLPAREVGGDFFDFFRLSGEGEERLGIVVADVSGKSVSGALVMAATRSVFRALAPERASVAGVMTAGNGRLKEDVRKGMFVALVYAVLDPEQGAMTLSSAGQTQPVLCPATGETPYFIETEGDRFPLGIVEDCDYRDTVVPLRVGDTVVFTTDGVAEAMNGAGELYGFERLLTVAGQCRELEAKDCLEHILEDVQRFVGGTEQHDDITVVVAQAVRGEWRNT